MRLLLSGVVLTLTTTSAAADASIERLKQLSLAMNAKMTETIVREVPEARDYIPTVKWNDEINKAAGCTLAAYEDRLGKDAVETLLSNMEALTARDDLNFEQFGEEAQKIFPIENGVQDAIESSCGMGKAMTASMMSDPNFPKFSQFMMKAMSAQ